MSEVSPAPRRAASRLPTSRPTIVFGHEDERRPAAWRPPRDSRLRVEQICVDVRVVGDVDRVERIRLEHSAASLGAARPATTA